jgi:ATP-dependent RNA helicase DDX60
MKFIRFINYLIYFNRLITQQKYENLSEYRKKWKYNSKLFLPPIEKEFRQRVDVYNAIVKEVYGCYIENVTKYLRTINNEQIEILPFSNISFAQQNFDYDNGSFEYHLHHHQSQQIKNPSISPFAGLSGLTHQYFMSNYNPIIGSWDLVYDIDLSSQIVPFIDIDCRDHMNIAYQLNSYVLDFYKHGSEKLLIMENELNSGDTYNLLLDFRLILSSITTSLKVIKEN